MKKEPIEVYHANEAVSHSKLCDFRKLPLYYYRKHIVRDLDPKDTKSLRTGRASHVMVLEGEEAFWREYCLAPDLSFQGRENKLQAISILNEILLEPLPEADILPLADLKKDEILAFFEGRAGKTAITEKQLEMFRALRESVFSHPQARELLAGDPAEHAELTWRTDTLPLGFAVQCRTDWWNSKGCKLTNGRPYVADWKTVASLDDLSFANWEKNFRAFGYYRQDPFYRNVINDVTGKNGAVERFFFIVTETTGLHQTMVFEADEAATEAGWYECVNLMQELSSCMSKNRWPGRPTGIHPISLPQWYLEKLNQEAEEASA